MTDKQQILLLRLAERPRHIGELIVGVTLFKGAAVNGKVYTPSGVVTSMLLFMERKGWCYRKNKMWYPTELGVNLLLQNLA